MKILIDMNLSPDWVIVLQKNGIDAVHWSSVGTHHATDREIMNYAFRNDQIVFTHDLDFGDVLAATGAKGPSVIQVRSEDITPDKNHKLILKALNQFSDRLEKGALITLVPGKMRARILPLKRN